MTDKNDNYGSNQNQHANNAAKSQQQYDEKAKMKVDQLKLQNNTLKTQILELSKKIEETIQKNKMKGIQFHPEYYEGQQNFQEKQEELQSIQQKITFYKDAIQKLKAQLDGFYNIKKIENIENEIKVKKETLNNLKYENQVLLNIQKNQQKALNQYAEKYENKTEVKLLQDKLRNLKEEYRYSKELLKSTESKLKSQHNLILAVDEKCKRLKEKIEEAKAKKDPNNANNQPPVSESEILGLEEKVRFMESQLAQEEKQYKLEINKQQETINKLNDEISILNLQLKEKDQEIRINELKLKELKKISKHNQLAPMRNVEQKYDKRSTSAKMQIRDDRMMMNRPGEMAMGKPKMQMQKSSQKRNDDLAQQPKYKNSYHAAMNYNSSINQGANYNYTNDYDEYHSHMVSQAIKENTKNSRDIREDDYNYNRPSDAKDQISYNSNKRTNIDQSESGASPMREKAEKSQVQPKKAGGGYKDEIKEDIIGDNMTGGNNNNNNNEGNMNNSSSNNMGKVDDKKKPFKPILFEKKN